MHDQGPRDRTDIAVRLRTHNQNMTVAARAMADRNSLVSVAAAGYTPPVFQPAKRDLNPVAPFVSPLVVRGFGRESPLWSAQIPPIISPYPAVVSRVVRTVFLGASH